MRSHIAHIFHMVLLDFRRRMLATLFALLAIALGFSLLIAMSTLVVNARHAVAGMRGDAVGIIFLANATDQTAKEWVAEIAKMSEVKETELISPTQATERLKKAFLENNTAFSDQLLDVMPWVVFVYGYEERASSFRDALKNLEKKPWIDTVVLPDQEVHLVRVVLNGLQAFLVFLTALIGILVAFVVSNQIRVLALQRRREVEIMWLVGATGSFVRAPFLIEGALLGFLGAVLGAFAFLFAHARVGQTFGEAVSSHLFGFAWVMLPFFWIAIFVVAGMAVGLGAAHFTLRLDNMRADDESR